MEISLPPIPAKRYFTIGEVSDLCGVKPYVLRYWEQEFTQLKPMKRRGNRRYYQHHEVLLIRRIRELLYEQGFTISGARNRLADMPASRLSDDIEAPDLDDLGPAAPFAAMPAELHAAQAALLDAQALARRTESSIISSPGTAFNLDQVRQELLSIRSLLVV
jgi:DNA-binding transcriptional MerR regulator